LERGSVVINVHWIYHITIILYALSVLGYFIDFLENNRKANRIAFWLLSIVWGFQLFFFVMRMVEYDRFPILTPFEGLFFYSWVLVTLSLVINWFFRVYFFVFFTNVIGFAILSVNLFAPSDQVSNVLSEQLVSELSVIHITMAFISYGAFTLSSIFSIMYLFQHQMLKKKKWSKMLWRLESLSRLEYMSFLLNTIGVPVLFLSLILGVIYANIKLEDFHWLDAKVVSSFIVLLVYSSYLYQKVGNGKQGRPLALWNIAAFLVVLINYFLSATLTKFHLWYL
jgi:HemX protein